MTGVVPLVGMVHCALPPPPTGTAPTSHWSLAMAVRRGERLLAAPRGGRGTHAFALAIVRAPCDASGHVSVQWLCTGIHARTFVPDALLRAHGIADADTMLSDLVQRLHHSEILATLRVVRPLSDVFVFAARLAAWRVGDASPFASRATVPPELDLASAAPPPEELDGIRALARSADPIDTDLARALFARFAAATWPFARAAVDRRGCGGRGACAACDIGPTGDALCASGRAKWARVWATTRSALEGARDALDTDVTTCALTLRAHRAVWATVF